MWLLDWSLIDVISPFGVALGILMVAAIVGPFIQRVR